ncbi:MAG: GFA family protein [Hydrogenophilaceae bacterium]|nr:GFA family protein [Hydrogenophilaceae bacterium]
MAIKGGCHCGRFAFEVDGAPTQAMECNCSHCARKGFLLWFVPADQFRLTAGDAAEMTLYTFNKGVIEHRFCPTCGVQPFARGKPPGAPAEMVAVNLRTVPDFDRGSVQIVPVDGKSF